MDTKYLIDQAIFILGLTKGTIKRSREAAEGNKGYIIDVLDEDITKVLMLFAEAKGVESVKPTEVVSVDDLQGRN